MIDNSIFSGTSIPSSSGSLSVVLPLIFPYSLRWLSDTLPALSSFFASLYKLCNSCFSSPIAHFSILSLSILIRCPQKVSLRLGVVFDMFSNVSRVADLICELLRLSPKILRENCLLPFLFCYVFLVSAAYRHSGCTTELQCVFCLTYSVFLYVFSHNLNAVSIFWLF